MKEYIKTGLQEGTKVMLFFAVITTVWALVIFASSKAGISPGWAMLTLFTGAIYFFSIATEKLKYESSLARVKTEENKNGGAE
jgi:hypothetical protein